MPAATKKKLAIGEEVQVHLGSTLWKARIVEDRGPIGVNARRLFRVQLLGDGEIQQFVEVPKEDIEPFGDR